MAAMDADALVVCLPPSGTGRSFFRLWPRRLGQAQVLALSRPGHEERMRDRLAPSLLAVAQDVVAQVRRRGPRAIVLVGHSLGATVAFEAARLLRDPGTADAEVPVSLVVSARQAPHLPSRAPVGDLDPLAAVLSWGGYGDRLDESVGSLLLPALWADLMLSSMYRWDGGRTDVPVTAISYANDTMVEEGAVRAWAAATTGPYRSVQLEGDHFTAREAPRSLIALLETVVGSDDRSDPRVPVIGD